MNHNEYSPVASTRKPKSRRGDYTIGKHDCPPCAATGKVRYRDHRQASHALQSAKWKRRHDDLIGLDSRRNEVRAYKCDECKGWHTTSIAVWNDPAVDRDEAAA